MLTIVDGSADRAKCFQYWPSSHFRPVQFGEFRCVVSILPAARDRRSLTLISEVEKPGYVVREFTLQVTGGEETRKIKHMQFVSWPDHGTKAPRHC